MLNQGRCHHCGNRGPSSRVVTYQDSFGDALSYLCRCNDCENTPSQGALRERFLDHIRDRIATRRVGLPRQVVRSWPERRGG